MKIKKLILLASITFLFSFCLCLTEEFTTYAERLYSKSDVSGLYDLEPVYSDIVIAECDVTPKSNSIDGAVNYVDSSAQPYDWKHYTVTIRMNKNGYFDVRNGAVYAFIAQVPYAANEVYHLKTIIDLKQQKYDVYITTPEGSTTQIASGYSFREGSLPMDDVGKLALRSAADSQFFVENHALSRPKKDVEIEHTIFKDTFGNVIPDNITVMPDTENITAEVHVSNNTDSNKTGRLIFAVYERGKLYDCTISQDTELVPGENIINTIAELPDNVIGCGAKLFLWNNLNNLTALATVTDLAIPSLSSNFDRGSIESMVETSPERFEAIPKMWYLNDGFGKQSYWFYFRLDNVANQNITITLKNISGNYRIWQGHVLYNEHTKPVYSYDKINWERIDDCSYTDNPKVFTFSKTFTKNTVWIAYAHPYSLEQLNNYINNIKSNSYVSTEVIGKSTEARDINLITITDKSVADKDKKVIFITGLTHPGEDAGGYFIEGMIDFLLSEAAEEIRKKFIYKFVPMLNPDGIFNGTSRYTPAEEDLNTEWDDDTTDPANAPVAPEISCVKQWLSNWKSQGKGIDIFIDVHCHGQTGFSNTFCDSFNKLKNFYNILSTKWQVNLGAGAFEGGSTDFMYKQYGVLSATIELTQSKVGADGEYLNISDYKNYGAGTVEALYEYYYVGI